MVATVVVGQGQQVADVSRRLVGAQIVGESMGPMRRDSLMLRETGLIMEMEREATEAGVGGWFNSNPEEVLESWSGANSDASAS